jgi:hypothetical protein
MVINATLSLPNKEVYFRALINLRSAFVNYTDEYFVSARN